MLIHKNISVKMKEKDILPEGFNVFEVRGVLDLKGPFLFLL